MDSSESISFSMDTTTDSIDVMSHFSQAKAHSSKHSPRKELKPRKMLLRETNNEIYDNETDIIPNNLPPDKEPLIVVDVTPPPSTASSASSSSCTFSSSSITIASSSATADCPSSQSQPSINHENNANTAETTIIPTKTITPTPTSIKKKSVLFDMVTVYHFNRSQGFTSIPSQGGSTLGMKRKHFLRRRISVDLYEEVRRRSRREILLKLKFEKKKREERLRLQQQRQLNDRMKVESSSTSSSASNTNTSDSDDNNDQILDDQDDDDNVDVDDDESYSDYSDISDSELESDSYIFLQPINVKLRRSLLRASGVGRIDPGEKRECNKIRSSREKSGCRCISQCIPEYCECSRLGVKCHVDRISFPCGCVSAGCRNPEGRTEFDTARVRSHFEEKVIKSDTWSIEQQLQTSDDLERQPITPTLSDAIESEEIC